MLDQDGFVCLFGCWCVGVELHVVLPDLVGAEIASEHMQSLDVCDFILTCSLLQMRSKHQMQPADGQLSQFIAAGSMLFLHVQ